MCFFFPEKEGVRINKVSELLEILQYYRQFSNIGRSSTAVLGKVVQIPQLVLYKPCTRFKFHSISMTVCNFESREDDHNSLVSEI